MSLTRGGNLDTVCDNTFFGGVRCTEWTGVPNARNATMYNSVTSVFTANQPT